MYHWTDDDYAPDPPALDDDRDADDRELFRAAVAITLMIAGISMAAVLGPLLV